MVRLCIYDIQPADNPVPTVRVWDVTQPENILKLATRPLGGKINDLAWDGESKRIIVGGEGKDRYVHIQRIQDFQGY